MTTYLGLEDLLALTRDLNAGPVRDLGLLDSASARPRSEMYGHEAYPSLSLKAAALLHSMCRNHALIDGSTRLAWLAATVFLDLNGARTGLTQEEAFTLVMAVAEGDADVAEIAERLRTTLDG